jgi:hypothetical protein
LHKQEFTEYRRITKESLINFHNKVGKRYKPKLSFSNLHCIEIPGYKTKPKSHRTKPKDKPDEGTFPIQPIDPMPKPGENRQGDGNGGGNGNVRCERCHKLGHLKANCPDTDMSMSMNEDSDHKYENEPHVQIPIVNLEQQSPNDLKINSLQDQMGMLMGMMKSMQEQIANIAQPKVQVNQQNFHEPIPPIQNPNLSVNFQQRSINHASQNNIGSEAIKSKNQRSKEIGRLKASLPDIISFDGRNDNVQVIYEEWELFTKMQEIEWPEESVVSFWYQFILKGVAKDHGKIKIRSWYDSYEPIYQS